MGLREFCRNFLDEQAHPQQVEGAELPLSTHTPPEATIKCRPLRTASRKQFDLLTFNSTTSQILGTTRCNEHGAALARSGASGMRHASFSLRSMAGSPKARRCSTSCCLRVLIHPAPRPRACRSRCVRAAPNSRIFAYAHRGSASGVIVKDD
jgi:hypothetical protein